MIFENEDNFNHELTKREDEVLDYVIEGLSNREIAEKLTITQHTSKAHVSSILHKLGVKTRAAAVRKGLEKRNKELRYQINT